RLSFVTNAREMEAYRPAFEAACARRVAPACGGRGLLYLHLGGDGDAGRGLELLRGACEGDDDIACAVVGETLVNGAGARGGEGERLLRERCDKLGGWPCTTVAQLEAQAGQPERAPALIDRACDTGDAVACYGAGQAYAEGGEGFAADAARATD